MGATCRTVSSSLVLLAVTIGLAASAHGHALQPGYLEIRLLDRELHAVVWKTPGAGGRPLPIVARLPDTCDAPTPVRTVWDGSAYVARWTTKCQGGLEGRAIRIEGLDRTSTDVLARLDLGGEAVRTHRFTAGASSFTIPSRSDRLEVARSYSLLGVQHILQGPDHLLFVFALMLLVGGGGRLLATITAFTLAHSFTLAGATLGLVHVPGPPVEAVIALSIVLVASEIVRSGRGDPSLAERRPWLVAFPFGLLHGLGFAGALSEIGLPEDAIPLALLFFNVGVEVGQLLFVAGVLTAVVLTERTARIVGASLWVHRRTVPAYAVGGLSAYWAMERLAAF